MPLASAARMAPESDTVEFTVSSSLPPMVAGVMAGEMELSVPYLYPKPGVMCSTRYLGDGQTEPMYVVRVQWWGDRGPGTVLKPGILRGRDEDGKRALRAKLSKATCALFPVRCGLDGLLTYLKDMGSITLDVLVHKGEPSGVRLVGRCIVPFGSWGGQLGAHPGLRESGVVAEGYFPVLSLHGNKYAGDLGVCLRACLGGSSKLRNKLVVAKMAVAKASIRGERRKTIENLDGWTLLPAGAEQSDSPTVGRDRGEDGLPGLRRSGKSFGGLPARASFDSDDLADGLAEAPPTATTAPARLPRGSAPLSSFQLNEALVKFDALDSLQVWPTPKGSFYRPPEAHGQALPPPRVGQQQSSRGRRAAGRFADADADARRQISPTGHTFGDRVGRSPPTRVALAKSTRTASVVGGAPRDRNSDQARPRESSSSVSPERQAPVSTTTDANRTYLSHGDSRGRAHTEASASSQGPASLRPNAARTVDAPASEPAGGGKYLFELISRGKDLRDKMTRAAGSKDEAPATPLPSSSSNDYAGLTAQPGLVSGAPLDSSLRDDIEGIFDTLSDGDPAVDAAGVLVRDPETRGNEERVVDLLLSAAGPPPSSLAFPALAAVERQRADSLARVRFLRIRLSRLVMFGSMTSAAEGHGWQLRFRLPAFTTPPGRGSAAAAAAGRRASGSQGAKEGVGWNARNVRAISVPVPPRVSVSTLGKFKATVRRGRSTAGTSRNAASVLRVRRGFGACDLVVGETSLLEEVVCAVDVDDACVTQWMDTAMEFLLVDGKTDGAPNLRPAGRFKNHPNLRKQQERKQTSTVGPGDRVAAVATLPLRDLILSADLGVATTLDLIEVSDFWAAEDARAAAAGRTGRDGRPLRNRYRSDESGGGARPLVLGDRAIGALAVALELVPGEPDVSPEHSRPEVERWTKGSRRHGATTATTALGQAEAEVERLDREESAEEGNDGVLPAEACLAPAPAAGDRSHRESWGYRSSSNLSVGDGTEAGEVKCSSEAERGVSGEEGQSEEKYDPTAKATTSLPARPPPKLDRGWKESSRAVSAGPFDTDCAVMLRIEDLTLVPAVGTGAEQVRVAYSFTQVEGHTPTVTHRSVLGHPGPLSARGGGDGQQRVPHFAFNHQEVFPAPAENSTWRLGAGTSRVFEVWGYPSEWRDGGGGGGGGEGPAQALLGLAKVSLRPFAAFECAGGSRLAVGADGPVVVVDPFSGKAVGDLRLFLALGASSTIAALCDSRGRDDAPEAVADEGGGGTTGGSLDPPGNAADEGETRAREEEEEEKEFEQEAEKRAGWRGGQKAGGGEDDVDASLADPGTPALDDSMAELSMLLNPGRAEKTKADEARSSGGFGGLIRHVIELSAVGELPLELDDGNVGGEDADEPVGCSIEYVLPSVQASLNPEADESETAPFSPQTHELWWDADSGILNSRARHTVKVPGGMLGEEPAGSTRSTGACDGGGDAGTAEVGGDRSLHNLLDCMFGGEDVVLSLFWSVGGAGVVSRQEAPWRQGGSGYASEAKETATKKQARTLLGKAVIRREDLLLLVQQPSSRAVLVLPIEPGDADASENSPARPAPRTLPLAISYRREPSAVARRKYRGWSGRRRVSEEIFEGDCGESLQEVDASCDTDIAGRPLQAGLGEEKMGGRGDGEASGKEQEDKTHSEALSPPLPGIRAPKDGFGAEGGSIDRGGSPDSLDSNVDRSSRTKHLLPACTTLCVHVESICFARGLLDVGKGADEKQDLWWVSFVFPGPASGGRPERTKGGVFVWESGDESAKHPEVHWSPAVVANWQGGDDRVALLQWRVELPVTIDTAFVDFVHTKSLELRVWRGDRGKWPGGGAAFGVAKIALRSLLTTLGGVGGDLTITPATDVGKDGVGSIAARVLFNHHAFGSNDSADARQEARLRGTTTHQEGKMAAALESEARGGGRPRGSVSFREEVKVLGQQQEEPGGRNYVDTAARRAGEDVVATAPGPPDAPAETPEPGASGEEKQPAIQSPLSRSGQNELRVNVERAIRLVVVPAAGSGNPDMAGEVFSPETVLPSTYVTFRWEKDGEPPLRSPLVSHRMPSMPSEEAGVVGDRKDCRGAQIADGEVTTPIVEQSANPVYNHSAQLRLVNPDDWGRVLAPSAALVFRVWHRTACNWWDAPQAPRTGAAGHQPRVASDEGVAAAAGSRFGDKLIGSAVVGLDVLRGAVDARGGLGLSEIDGWYHVLDDMRRPRGQIKVQVRPQPPGSLSDQASQSWEHPPTSPDVPPNGHLDLFVRQPAAESTDTDDNRVGRDVDPPTTPPLHDTQAHLRSVYALLDSLPAEFRSTRPWQSLPSSISSKTRSSIELELPSVSDGPAAAATENVAATSPPAHHPEDSPSDPRCAAWRYDCEQSRMPELRRMLSSLDRVDRRLFALGDGAQNGIGSVDAADAEYGSGMQETDSGLPVVDGVPTAKGSPLQARGFGAVGHAAISRLQRAWRARSRRERDAAQAKADQQACALRQKRREKAAGTIQVAHRRAQARHRARAAAEERRRWESQQRRRAAACAVLERAWRAFETRRRAARELAEARGRAAAAVAAAATARRAEETARGAVLIQAAWRGMSARAAATRRIEESRIRSRAAAAAAAAANVVPPAERKEREEREASLQPATTGGGDVATAGISLAPRPLPLASPSTFYNQLSQDPRRGQRLQLPEAHLAALPYSHGLAPHARSLVASHSVAVNEDVSRKAELRENNMRQSERFGPRPLARSAGATRPRPPRFADQETARIARIMKGNLQHWANARSSSSSDEIIP